ncbi:MAG TPA: hypothetical protein VF221_12445, partial [Chloroflexota bacterium]
EPKLLTWHLLELLQVRSRHSDGTVNASGSAGRHNRASSDGRPDRCADARQGGIRASRPFGGSSHIWSGRHGSSDLWVAGDHRGDVDLVSGGVTLTVLGALTCGLVFTGDGGTCATADGITTALIKQKTSVSSVVVRLTGSRGIRELLR